MPGSETEIRSRGSNFDKPWETACRKTTMAQRTHSNNGVSYCTVIDRACHVSHAASLFVAEVDGIILGIITTSQDQAAVIGRIPNLSIAQKFQGYGMGRKLIQRALDWFRQSRLTHAKIETVVQNETGNYLYRSVGFHEIARQIHYVGDLREMESS